ncbi:phosphatidylinositol mannoside acyltransferase [Ruania halotolerans]|uniref:phosphatidylinositol mannoside acyltransferase n=1 Tax=Ruania halotolerans TaxID=2897773 RepID=UPI001E5659D6|nr:phosphatidylinositol mannoside acyltransferase [Ruania halotolerans]UFU04774.1 phosphatidylinositol mannoside acyltransferase [Ruania halotolerans]
MSAVDPARVFALAWRVVPRLPGPLARGIFDVVAIVAHGLRVPGVVQLERNLDRFVPGQSRRRLRRLSRAGMRSYMRYYCEAFQLPAMTQAQVDARVRATGHERIAAHTAAGETVVLALGHAGNWDLAGAWANRHLGTVITVAERLEPEELFQEFVEFRESLGMVIVPFERGGGVFRRLLSASRRPGVVPLLADRDLSSTGVEVPLGAHTVMVAPGPAALALARNLRLVPVLIHYERLYGARRKAARSPWGIHIHFLEEVPAPDRAEYAGSQERVAALTRRWFRRYADALARVPQDWHMLQKIYTKDLDPERLARARAASQRHRGQYAPPATSSSTEGRPAPGAEPNGVQR